MTTVFTNSCFDLLHPGHVDLLERARALGDRLMVGLNSDRSVRTLKGAGRPFLPQEDRAAALRALRSVDDVYIFDELTPARLLEELQPDILVKGGLAGRADRRRRWAMAQRWPGAFVTFEIGLFDHGAGRENPGSGWGSYAGAPSADGQDGAESPLTRSLWEHAQTIERLTGDRLPAIQAAAELIVAALKSGRKLLLCGNGGSAADAQYIVLTTQGFRRSGEIE